MKRQRIELADLAERGNLALATWKAARGKRQRPAVAAFLADLDARLTSLAENILQGHVPDGRVRRFVIHDPKRREITAACFEDRVLHHALMNRAEERLERVLVDSVYACRSGRGVHSAVAAVQRGLQHWPWVVQVDVDGYFAHIDHAVLKAQLARRLKGAEVLALIGRIIDSGVPAQPDGQRAVGLPIGALCSQHFANGYLDSADRLLLACPGVTAQVRYMDDIVWFCRTREAAQASLAALRTHLSETLHLTLKDRVLLQPTRRGLLFCGYRVRPGVILAGPRKLRRYRQAVVRLQHAETAGVDGAALQRAHDANVAALLPAQSRRWRQRLWAAAQAPTETRPL